MANLLKLKTENGNFIYIETAEDVLVSQSGQVLASPSAHLKNATTTLKDSLAPVSEVIEAVFKSLTKTELQPDKLEVELGLKLSADGNIIISKVSGEVALKIKAIWEKNKP
jgi:hypothetical protein